MSDTVGIVLVSHSRTLAAAVTLLARQMAGQDVRIEIAAGAGDDHQDLGTDATEIVAAIEAVDSAAGTLVLMDLGSAILSAETALDLIDSDLQGRIVLCAAPFVEGALAAATAAAAGAALDAVRDEARSALGSKRMQLGEDDDTAASDTDGTGAEAEAQSIRVVTIGDPAGLHLRPAAEITRILRAHRVAATLAPAENTAKQANAASLTAMLGLGLRAGASVRIAARGTDADMALDAIEQVLATGGLSQESAPPGRGNDQTGPDPASPGIAIGPAFTLRPVIPHFPQTKTRSPAKAHTALRSAVDRARAGMDPSNHPVLAAQRDLLDDPALQATAFARIDSQQLEAVPAWAETIRDAAAALERLDDSVLRGRAADIRDVGLRVLKELGADLVEELASDTPVIIIAEDLLPSLAATFDSHRVLGVIDRAGGTTTHAMILLRARGIPAVVNVSALGDVPDGTELAIDGSEGRVWRQPDPGTRRELEARREAERHASEDASGVIIRGDGARIELWANVASVEESAAARRADAQGIGLLRTEFLFLDRPAAPSEDEQASSVGAILEPMHGRPVHVRTLDAGADKPIAFLPLGHETNPYLGQRGIRATLAHPELFSTQLRALLRAGTGHDLGIMLPMVTNPEEVVAARESLEAAHRDLTSANVSHAWPIRLGIMVEVPAAALRITRFSDICEFYSIGTNDLTQYVLAADRGNGKLASFHHADHPAVLALCSKVASEGRRPTSVCGEAAGDPRITRSLIDCGIHTLSMAPTLFGAIRLRAMSDSA